jgi:ATP-dependent DNA helicase DinG
MPKIIEEPDLISCDYAKDRGWPEKFRIGATFCNKCDQINCPFHQKRSYHESGKKAKMQPKARVYKIKRKEVKSILREMPSELNIRDVLAHFPSKSMRKYQKEIMIDIVDAFQTGKRCIILSAPTGFGKSYVNATFCSIIDSFYTTPQLALIEQILKDPLIGSRFVEIKGRQNYYCHHSPNYSVNKGRCITKDYTCRERYEVCPYWIQKKRAQSAQSILTSFAYLIAEGQTEGTSETYLGKRSLLVLDEAHNIEEQGLNYVSVRISPFTIPFEIYKRILPDLNKIESDSQLKEFLQKLERILRSYIAHSKQIIDTTGLSIEQAEDIEKIERYLANYTLYEISKSEWVWQLDNDQLTLQPVFAKEFMKELVWKRADHYIISSATILDPYEFSELNGIRDLLKDDEICFLKAPSTFPVQNRPVIDSLVGPLSSQGWDNNKEKALLVIEEILEKEKGNVAIHCHSYKHQRWLVDNISEIFKARLIIHSSRDREQRLNEWIRSHGKVFVSVAFNEGQDWKYDICDAQILMKVPFPYLGDKRVRRRLELGHDKWYRNYAMSEVIQAYGRAIRAEDDKARFYIVDGSFLKLTKDCWNLVPDWFKEVLPDSIFRKMEYNRY